jgi:CBS domain-containing protein
VLIGLGIFLAVEVDLLAGVWLVLVGVFIGQAARAAVAQSQLTAGIERLEVKDVMDSEPVAAVAETSLDRAHDELFLRYGWPWFPVVDGTGHYLGLLAREDVEGVPEAERRGRSAGELVRQGSGETFSVRIDDPLEALLGSEALRRLGAVMAVDSEGVLRGVLTLGRLRRALRTSG